ncbi:MAG: hypothetical protein ACOVSW_22130 [Candidatus Kapaibacteriota bacterium]|jgi:hypothetical protein
MNPREAIFYAAFGLYCVNMLVGVIAHLRLYHFGKAHHVLYFVVFLSAGVATTFAFHPALLLTLLALSLMPKSRPWTWKHPVCAGLGAVGYILALLIQF